MKQLRVFVKKSVFVCEIILKVKYFKYYTQFFILIISFIFAFKI